MAIDLTQEVFMKYWDSLVKNIISNEKAFLFTIARHSIIDWYRKKKPVPMSTFEDDGIEDFFLREDGAKESVEMASEGRFLIDKIAELSPTYQHVLYLRYVEGMGVQEMSEVMDVKENAVSVRIHRAVEELRKITGYSLQ